jgi:spore coat polysaccharide biosynthesis predicted glycosyltransferase SpsG
VSAPAILVRCDGSAALGMGHVSRGLALAGELRDAHGASVTFAMRDLESAGVAAVRSNGYTVAPITDRDDADYGSSLLELIASLSARVLIVDVRDALSRASLDRVRASGVRVVAIDDGSERRLAADLAFYPPVPQVEELDWTGFTGARFTGWEWVLLKREFAADEERDSPPWRTSQPIDILVTMGGSDPAGMTEFVVDALNLLPQAMAVEVVIGPAFNRTAALAAGAGRSKHAVRVTQGPDAMAPLMRESLIAVASFGVSAYELAACGVPAVHLCLTEDHARSASAFVREGIAESLGVFPAVQPAQLADAVAGLLSDPQRRDEMAARARALVDGRGAKRVAGRIVAGLS